MNTIIKYKQWTTQEKETLINRVRDCKNPNNSVNWAAVAKGLPNRTKY